MRASLVWFLHTSAISFCTENTGVIQLLHKVNNMQVCLQSTRKSLRMFLFTAFQNANHMMAHPSFVLFTTVSLSCNNVSAVWGYQVQQRGWMNSLTAMRCSVFSFLAPSLIPDIFCSKDNLHLSAGSSPGLFPSFLNNFFFF